jgi:hypothetical protein
MDAKKLKAWWWHRQGLDGALQGKSAAEVLESAGWARSVGGVAPYLTLYSRGRIAREAADQAVASLEIHELPTARGCTYVVPASDFAFGLKAGAGFNDADMKTAAKLGVTDQEVAKLRDAVVKALEKGPLDPEGIREATGKASRNLGEEGKKKGMITTLPLALGQLQVMGEIRRVPMNGRLDQQRYRYCLWRPNPLENFRMEPEEIAVELARRFFRWIGPATVAEFQWFSALGAKAAKAAMEQLKLQPLDEGSGLMILPADRDAFEKFRAPKQARYELVSSLDGLTLFKRNTKDLLDADDATHTLFAKKAYAGANLSDLPSHGIFDRGRLVGLWEYDTATESIAWTAFIPKNRDLTKAVEATEEYVRSGLGDARSFSLDSPKSRVPRLEALRAAK